MAKPQYNLAIEDNCLTLSLQGDWSATQKVPDFPAIKAGKNPSCTQLHLINQGIERWDSMLMVFVMQCYRWCKLNSVSLELELMPNAVAKLLGVATAVTPYSPSNEEFPVKKTVWPGATQVKKLASGSLDFLQFAGSLARATGKFISGKATVRRADILYFIDQLGPKGLGIITLISVLVGMILAYLGSVQLRRLGAQIYVADLVGIGMTREMGALMSGIILAGRTGAAYAAQLGSMQVNEEIDALKTMGVPIIEFLVLPRTLALLIIMPLLCIYSDVLGMLGGALVATGMDVSWNQYLIKTQDAVDLVDFAAGIVKSVVFAVLIGIAGCEAGLKCGRDSTAVGSATTTAVVRALVYLIVADVALNLLYDKMGI